MIFNTLKSVYATYSNSGDPKEGCDPVIEWHCAMSASGE